MLRGYADCVSRLSVCVTNNRTLLKKRDIYSRSYQIGLSLIPPPHSFIKFYFFHLLKIQQMYSCAAPLLNQSLEPETLTERKEIEHGSCYVGGSTSYAPYVWIFADLHNSQQL